MQTEEHGEMFQKCFPFMEHLTEEEKNQLYSHTTTNFYPRGTAVHNGSNDCIGVLMMKSGQLRTHLLSEDGRDITLYRLFPYDVCILSASCIINVITFDVFIDAEEDSEILLIDSAFFHQLAEKNIYVKCFQYELATARFSDVMWVMQQILFMSADRRLAIFLTDEMAKSGSDELKLTHEQIAKYMGSAREVVSRILKYFAEEGIVKLSRGSLKIIDKKKLRQLTL